MSTSKFCIEQRQQEQQQRKIADPSILKPAAEIDQQRAVEQRRQGTHETHQSST